MNSKITLSIVGVFVILVLASLVSALQFSSQSQTLSPSTNQTTLILSSAENVSVSSLAFSPATVTEGSSSLTFNVVSPATSFNLTNSQEIKVGVSNLVNLLTLKQYKSTLTASGNNGTDNVNASVDVVFQKGFCKAGRVGGNLSIDRVDISSSGDDDNDWKPLDEITVEVRVNNDNDDVDIKEVIVELGMYDENNKNKVSSFDFSNTDEEKIDLGTINNGDDKTATFEFKVPADFNFDDGSSFKLVVKAYSDKTGETKECADASDDLDQNIYQEVSISRQDDDDKFIAFDQTQLAPEEATCSESVTLSTRVFNVGDSDQSDVTVILFNKALGLNLKQDIKNGLDTDQDATVNFDFTVPNVKDGTYNLELSADYEDGVSDEVALVPLKVLGCAAVAPERTIGLSVLAGAAQAGKTLEVRATVTNLGKTSGTFIVGASGYDSWAALQPVSNRILTLNAGESKEVVMNLDVSKSASGEKTLSVEVLSGDSTESKDVSVDVVKSSGFAGLSEALKGNATLWIIGLINIVLIIIIIVVAVRVARK